MWRDLLNICYAKCHYSLLFIHLLLQLDHSPGHMNEPMPRMLDTRQDHTLEGMAMHHAHTHPHIHSHLGTIPVNRLIGIFWKVEEININLRMPCKGLIQRTSYKSFTYTALRFGPECRLLSGSYTVTGTGESIKNVHKKWSFI